MEACGIGEFVKVLPMDGRECPVGSVTAGLVGMVEDVWTDSEGDTAALVWFGERVPILRSDACWIYLEHLEVWRPEKEE